MGYTLVEKILMKNTGLATIKAGQLVTVNVDHTMVHDLFVPFVKDKFYEMGFKKVWDPNKIAFIYDHLVPTSFIEDSRHHQIGNAFAKEQGIKKVHHGEGVCHQLMPEFGYAKPGNIVFGTDSHTTTYGGVGCFSTGIGYTEMASIFGTGKLWVKVPATIKFVINGKLRKGVYAKDIILKIIGDIGADGATYKAMEFAGTTVEAMSVASRMTLCNMAIEAGAKIGIVAPDEKICEFSNVALEEIQDLYSDEDAVYNQIYYYNAEDIEPSVACPSNVDNVKSISKLEGTPIDQGFLGSCTNGRLEDLAVAAKILEGKKISPFTKFIVTPASQKVYLEAVQKGYISTFIKAGAIIMPSACGLCCGRSGGIVAEGERVIATNNRNFLGRMGSSKAEIFLASPATVAASVLMGKITDPGKIN